MQHHIAIAIGIITRISINIIALPSLEFNCEFMELKAASRGIAGHWPVGDLVNDDGSTLINGIQELKVQASSLERAAIS